MWKTNMSVIFQTWLHQRHLHNGPRNIVTQVCTGMNVMRNLMQEEFSNNSVTPDFKDKIGCKILCAPRDQSHT